MVKQERDHDHEEEDDYLDTLLQEAIDEVNARSFGRQVPHEEMISSDEESENESDSLPSLKFVDAVQQIQHEMVSSDKGIGNGDSTSSPVHLDAIQQKSGNKRKRRAPKQSFDDHFNDLMAFKAKYGHCDVSQRGEDAYLGKWCVGLRVSYKKMQNNQKPTKKVSDEQIQRLIDAGFKWSIRGGPKVGSVFDDHFNELMAFKAKYGHCDVSQRGGDASLGRWCSVVRGSYKKMQHNLKPQTKLSDEQIQRLSDAGFKWCLQKKEKELTSNKTFDDRFNELMTFKAKYGHCDISQRGDDASLGQWCSVLRMSYNQIQHNQKPQIKLSHEQFQHLNDAGFQWSLRNVGADFDDRFNDLMAFKAKYGHCDVSKLGEDASLGIWCKNVRASYQKMQNNQKPTKKVSDEQIQRLIDAGFKWSLRKVG